MVMRVIDDDDDDETVLIRDEMVESENDSNKEERIESEALPALGGFVFRET